MTELDNLKDTWQNLNSNLERQHTHACHTFSEQKRSRIRYDFSTLVFG